MGSEDLGTMSFGSTAKVLAKRMLKQYRISECWGWGMCPKDGMLTSAAANITKLSDQMPILLEADGACQRGCQS